MREVQGCTRSPKKACPSCTTHSKYWLLFFSWTISYQGLKEKSSYLRNIPAKKQITCQTQQDVPEPESVIYSSPCIPNNCPRLWSLANPHARLPAGLSQPFYVNSIHGCWSFLSLWAWGTQIVLQGAQLMWPAFGLKSNTWIILSYRGTYKHSKSR